MDEGLGKMDEGQVRSLLGQGRIDEGLGRMDEGQV